ncbi:uncharacterized protein LOC133829918 [Humulus lupulus]|uniref:uncharacterized protein LOC133829918 n=1 Tax=Humulus lupulus TaxID=3486 RepID=UPI002B417D22|nr:uncharacterized protein LOC133829918 [Humulus lupulus]
MVMRETMWKKKKKNFGGEFPDYGAIFMSNRATLHECLRSKLFGLPNSYSHFVKQVRSGMILFLFEYEERRLHGVFQACSDGEMNIVTYAYKKASGRLFPAQVRFIRIWDCYPLGESEFRDAIEDNYYETYKFNFGLSQYQVNRLLWLFNSKKMVVGTSKILSCRRKREPDYEFEDGEVETERSPFRKTLSSGTSVVICNESESSPLDYTANVCGSSLSQSQVSELSCNSGGCRAASNDIGSGSETIISEKESESLEESSKDVGTDDLGDFIPLSSPDNSECVVDCVSNDQTEFASSLKQFFPLALLNTEDLGKKNIDVEFAAPRLDGLPLDALPCPSPRTGDCPSNEGTRNLLDVKPLYSDAQEKRSSVFSRLNFSSKDIGEDKNASGDEDSEYNLLPKGEEKNITRGNDRVQDIMDSLVQRHNSWNKFKPKNVFLKQEVVDSGVRKNVFSRLSSE